MHNLLCLGAIPCAAVPYGLSFRRTDERNFWRVLTLFSIFPLGFLAALAAITADNMTLGGAVATTLIPTFLLGLAAFGVEINDQAGMGVARYRKSLAEKRDRELEPPPEWKAKAVVTQDSSNVLILIHKNEVERLIGEVDLIENEDAFQNVMARAQEIAATLNAHGVKTTSKSLVLYNKTR